MTQIALTGFVLGVLAAAGTLFALTPLSYSSLRTGWRSKALAAGAFLLPLLGLALLANKDPHAGSATALATASTLEAPAAAGDDWALISHMMGGPPPTAAADNGGPETTTPKGHSVQSLQAMVASEPRNALAWLALANAQRQSRDYAAAVVSFDKVLQLDPRNADAWADYADALASAGNRRLEGAPATAIHKALQLDPRHAKALWLQASLDLELRRHADALKHWQALRAVLPDGSPDISIVEANISEARELLAKQGGG